jgi:thiamine biosynthesis protein ThiI
VTTRTWPANGLRVEPCVLLKRGEQQWFERHLVRCGRHAPVYRLDAAVQVRSRHCDGVSVVSSADLLQSDLVARTGDVLGVSVVQPVWGIAGSAVPAQAAAGRMLAERGTGTAAPTLAGRCPRRDRRFGLTLRQLAARSGARARADLGWRVDLTCPGVEVDRREIFVKERHSGPGGLPVGSSGHAPALLSGGFDSPVVCDAMCRGLRCEIVHRTGPYTGASAGAAPTVAQCRLCLRPAKLAATVEGVGLSVLRTPLGFGTREIDEARRIRAGESAALGCQDCCRLLQPRRAAISTTTGRRAEIQARADLDALVDNVSSRLREIDLDTGETHHATIVVKDQ